MDSINPYEAPAQTGPKSEHTPHGTSLRQEAWRGAKFGASITAFALTVMTAIVWVFMAGLGVYRWLSASVSPLDQIGGALNLVRFIGGSIFVIALTSFYAAIAGAIVMSIAALVRKLRRGAGPS